MKWLVVSIFLLLSFCSFSQGENPYQNSVGINLTLYEGDGLGGSFRYRRQIGSKGIAKIEFSTNLSYVYIGRIGYEPLQFKWNRLELGLGLDLKYKYNDLERFGQFKYSQLDLELPIELRFNITDEHTIYGGLSLFRQLTSTAFPGISDRGGMSEIRFGVGHNF